MVRPAYVGDKRSLVLAFDIGTTFSGVSYALLDPGQVPKINSVIRYASPLMSVTLLKDFSQIPRSGYRQFQNPLNHLV